MQITVEKIYKEAVTLLPKERAELIDKIITSFSYPEQKSNDELWAKEAVKYYIIAVQNLHKDPDSWKCRLRD